MFAAGFGTRMNDLTKDRPKPLIPVAGRPLIDHAAALARAAGCAPLVANLHYKADQLVSHLRPMGIETVIEHPDILETGGGLRNALPQLGSGPVVTMNTDAIWAGPNPVEAVIKAWQPEVMDALLVCVPVDAAVGHDGAGDFTLDPSGRINRGPGMVFGGVQILKTDRLKDIADTAFSLNILWNRMAQDGRLYGMAYDGRWCDVGHPDGIRLAEDMLAAQDV